MGILIGIISFALGALAGVTVSALCTAASEESRRRETEVAPTGARSERDSESASPCSEGGENEPADH